MATRATYTFQCDDKFDSYKHNFYIHHDGYPEGAVMYLKYTLIELYKKVYKRASNEEKLIAEKKNDVINLNDGAVESGYSLHDAFLRANENCELIGEEACKRMGDLDYKYTFTKVNGNYFVTVAKYIITHNTAERTLVIVHENMPLINFMREYNNTEINKRF